MDNVGQRWTMLDKDGQLNFEILYIRKTKHAIHHIKRLFHKKQNRYKEPNIMTKLLKENNISNNKTELRRQKQKSSFEALHLLNSFSFTSRSLLVHFSLGPRSSLVRYSLVIR